MDDDSQLRDLAERAARLAAGELRNHGAGSGLEVDTKSTETDLVTRADRAAEQLIVETLLTERPDDAVLGEEAGARPGTSGVRWVVDPLDGTTNFVYGIPQFAVSIAAERDGRPVAAVVLDVSRDECFTAARDQGAACDGRPIAPTGHDDLATALVGTGFAYDADRRRDQAAGLATILPAVRDIRRAGSAALDLCWVACGRLDGYWERNLAPWDLAAGALIAGEAGARTGGLDGGPAVPVEAVVAATPELFEPLRGLLIAASA